jgi:hypothetical protein
MTDSVPINFADYNLSTMKNILTAKPKSRTVPAVTVNLHEDVGVDNGELKCGKRNFSKFCQDIKVVQKNGFNCLYAKIPQKDGSSTESYLKLDGALQVRVNPSALQSGKQESGECCNICTIA